MRHEDFNTYGDHAAKVFDNFGSCSYSGIIYTCKVLTDNSRVTMKMRCLVWTCMN